MWLVALIVAVLLATLMTKREGFADYTSMPLHQPPKPTASVLDCVARAVDREIPVKPGDLEVMPTDRTTVEQAMRVAVSTINRRCSADFYVVAIDNPKKMVDAAKTVQCVAQVHVFSRHLNISSTLTICTLQPSGLARTYVQRAMPLSSCKEDLSGVQAAPPNVFDNTYSEYQLF